MIKNYTLGAVSLNGTAESAISRDSFSISPQLGAELLHAGGEARPSFAGTLTSRPVVTFQTWNLMFLTEAEALTGAGFSASLPEIAADGEFGSSAISYAASQGLAVPTEISAQAGQTATLAVSIYPVSSDGSAAPLAAGTTKTLPGRITGGIYTLGSVKIGGTSLGGISQVSLSNGYNVLTNEGENGYCYPTLARIDRHTPEFSVTFSDLSGISAAQLLTGEVPAGAVSCSFSKVNEGGIPMPDALTVVLSRAFVDLSGLQGGAKFSGTLRFRPVIPESGDFFSFGEALP